jgi:hypothetical protein
MIMNRCEMCKKNPLHPDKKCCFNCSRQSGNCDVWHNCGEDCPGWDNAVKTNADRIRAMSDEELADLLRGMCKIAEQCDDCPMDGNCPDGSYDFSAWNWWLKQPAEVTGDG